MTGFQTFVLPVLPGEVPVFMAFENDTPLMTITTAPRPDSKAAEMTIHVLNRATGETTGRESEEGVMHFLLQLHTDMFLGLPGMLFLGLANGDRKSTRLNSSH